MGKKSLDQLRTGSDFVSYVEHHPATREIRQSGSHVCVKGPNPGTAVFPNHGGKELAPGTRRSVVKMLVAIGLAGVTFLCMIAYILLELRVV
jgi:hypothetical protein